MGRAYSQDLRDRVIAAVEAGQSCNAAAERFNLSVSCVVKWLQRYHREGSRSAKKMGGYRPFALADHRVFVVGRIAEKPDLTIDALRAELAARGIRVSRFAVWHFLKHVRLSFKKKEPARRRAGPSRRGPASRALEASAAQARR
jgi:putative transposase